ncbi:hypothetical protein PVK06_039794 [Gossypium arboreum]|uniref:Uncharacterized protein n=1 Tax=Gossypium arboreum TaxID=29729 RepID=A0ABR0N4E3_GOSAR|nr:hypothetical protein PVK06_039794 [Gossypium arboreum]
MFWVLVLNVLPVPEFLHVLRILHSSCEQHRVATFRPIARVSRPIFTTRMSIYVKELMDCDYMFSTLRVSYPVYPMAYAKSVDMNDVYDYTCTMHMKRVRKGNEMVST